MRRGANPRVSWEKKQFHLDNAATVKLHLAFADKSTPVTEEFSTPQAICAVHWTSESQQAPRHTQGIIPFRAEGWGNHSIGWAKGLGGYASKRAKFLEWEWGGVRDPKEGSHFSYLWPVCWEHTKNPEKGRCNFDFSAIPVYFVANDWCN